MAIKDSKNFPLYILMVNMFIAMTGIGLIIPIMPAVLKEFGVGGQVYGLLIATFAFAQFVFSPIAGTLSDRFGRKKMIVIGLILFGGSQFVFGLSNVVWLLFVSRMLGGLGAAFMVPSMMAYVADVTTMKDRAKGMGRLGASMSLGFVIGPGIGGFLAAFGLRAPFFIAAGVAGIAAIASFFFLPETRNQSFIQKNMAIGQKGDHLFKQLARSVKTPYFVLLIMMLTMSFGLANFQSTINLFVNFKFGFDPLDISILMVTGGLIGVIVQAFVLDRLFRRFGEIPVIHVTLVVAAISFIVLLFTVGFWSVLTVSIFFFTAASLLRPAINTMVSKMAGEEQGFAAGMNNAYMSIGNMVGPALAGILFDVNMGLPYVVGAIIVMICFVISIRWARHHRVSENGTIGYRNQSLR
jgi:DHA1 family multidrug resistance protein-like MFS transporter